MPNFRGNSCCCVKCASGSCPNPWITVTHVDPGDSDNWAAFILSVEFCGEINSGGYCDDSPVIQYTSLGGDHTIVLDGPAACLAGLITKQQTQTAIIKGVWSRDPSEVPDGMEGAAAGSKNVQIDVYNPFGNLIWTGTATIDTVCWPSAVFCPTDQILAVEVGCSVVTPS